MRSQRGCRKRTDHPGTRLDAPDISQQPRERLLQSQALSVTVSRHRALVYIGRVLKIYDQRGCRAQFAFAGGSAIIRRQVLGGTPTNRRKSRLRCG